VFLYSNCSYMVCCYGKKIPEKWPPNIQDIKNTSAFWINIESGRHNYIPKKDVNVRLQIFFYIKENLTRLLKRHTYAVLRKQYKIKPITFSLIQICLIISLLRLSLFSVKKSAKWTYICTLKYCILVTNVLD